MCIPSPPPNKSAHLLRHKFTDGGVTAAPLVAGRLAGFTFLGGFLEQLGCPLLLGLGEWFVLRGCRGPSLAWRLLHLQAIRRELWPNGV